MPAPLVIAGLAVVGVASVVSWLYNEATEEEERRQTEAQAEYEALREQLELTGEENSEAYAKLIRKAAKQYKKKQLKLIAKNAEKIQPISEALDQLFTLMIEEVSADTTSPYRRSALLREFARVEDAQARLSEYERYLHYQEERVQSAWEEEAFTALLEIPLVDPLLPDEWLYVGKLLMVEMNEVGRRLPMFGHRLLFDGSRTQQQALASEYGSEFPLLVVKKGKKNDGAFFSCVARGVCHYDYIMKGEPISMCVERYLPKEKAYQGSVFDGMVRVKLPEANLLSPALRMFNGQSTLVYFHSYDGTLRTNPAITSKEQARYSLPAVSEKQPAMMGYDELDLYIEVDDALLDKVTDKSFFTQDSTWTLMSGDTQSREVVLGKASVRLHCLPTDAKDGLRVVTLLQCETHQIGVDMPFDFVLVSSALEPSKYFSWPYGLEEFYNFASQALLSTEGMQDRIEQSKFFKRWERVVQYQKETESERSLEFYCRPTPLEKHQYQLVISKDEIARAVIGDKSLSMQLKEVRKSEYLSVARCCRLMVWDSASGHYLYAIEKSRVHEAEFLLDDTGALRISASLVSKYATISLNEVQQFKLTIALPNPSLMRQAQALSALFEDRMVEPRLKDIFLSPSTYRAESIAAWRDREIVWDNQLTPSQEEVVRTALTAKHLAMVQGPPGTGKTTTIVEMLYQLITANSNQRILVVSQQNTAVDNAISKFKKRYPALIAENVSVVRVGNPEKIEDDMKTHHLDRVFSRFLSDKIDYVDRTASNQQEELKAAAYEWAALLRHTKERLSSGQGKVSDEFFMAMLADKNLIGATCVGLAGRKAGIDHLAFDVAIVDEAGRATVPELLIPLLRAKKAILIGDHHQLPPSIAPVLREESAKQEMAFLEETFLEKSFFEVLFDQLPSECTASLKEQFRMSPPIGDLVAKLFYTKNGERQLFNGAGDEFDDRAFVVKDCLVWCDVKGKQRRPNQSTSLENPLEATAISGFLRQIAQKQQEPVDVAVITPYGAQKRVIRRALAKGAENNNLIKLGNLNVKVDTVDSFQGSEAELVIYSTVRTTGSLQFLLDKKRLNVACSRAKQSFIVFGDQDYLKRWKPKTGEVNLFAEILAHCKTFQYKPSPREAASV